MHVAGGRSSLIAYHFYAPGMLPSAIQPNLSLTTVGVINVLYVRGLRLFAHYIESVLLLICAPPPPPPPPPAAARSWSQMGRSLPMKRKLSPMSALYQATPLQRPTMKTTATATAMIRVLI
eukprot:COSAG05_NODE_231_length_13343_cov_199.670417_2_plen_121_part_00